MTAVGIETAVTLRSPSGGHSGPAQRVDLEVDMYDELKEIAAAHRVSIDFDAVADWDETDRLLAYLCDQVRSARSLLQHQLESVRDTAISALAATQDAGNSVNSLGVFQSSATIADAYAAQLGKAQSDLSAAANFLNRQTGR